MGKISKNELDIDQRLQLSEFCWTQILKVYQVEWSLIVDRMIGEQATGAKKYTVNDFTEERVKLAQKLTNELEASSSQEAIEEVRKRLEIVTKTQ